MEDSEWGSPEGGSEGEKRWRKKNVLGLRSRDDGWMGDLDTRG